MEAESKQPKGAAIIMHGRGFHPDWADVVRPLRTGLPETGWHTLSLQMPVLEKTAKYYDYVPIFQESFSRIDAAIHYLKAKDISNIVLIAHSCSVHMSMAWFEDKKVTDVSAYIAIGMGATDYKQPMAQPFALDKLSFPIFDIYGAEDYPAVINQAPERLSMLKKAGHLKSQQQAIAGANHYFTDQGDKLLEAINSWLDTL
jgi:pimeloyl-ACP methyl ester carboxylesterase